MGLLRSTRQQRSQERERQRDLLLETATQLLAQRPWGELTLEELARRSGLSQGTGTMHFDTREKLALHLLERQLRGLYSELEAQLRCSDAALELPVAALLLAQHLSGARLLRRLLALLPVLQDGGADLAEVLAFRRRQQEAAQPVAAALAERVEGLDARAALVVLRRLETSLAGLEGLLPLAGNSALTLEDPLLQPLVVEPADELEVLARLFLEQAIEAP